MLNPIAFIHEAASAAASAVHRHPHRLTAAVVAALMGTAVTAFGVVAPLPQPEAALGPQRLVVERVVPADPIAQLDALDARPLQLHRTELTRRGDTVDTLLKRLGARDESAIAYLRRDSLVQAMLDGRPNRSVEAVTAQGRLLSLVLRGPASQDSAGGLDRQYARVSVESLGPGQGFHSRREVLPLQSDSRIGSGTITSSLFAASDDALIPDAVTEQLAELFSTDIDFRRDLRRGDTFTVVYERLLADGEPAQWIGKSARILSARFVNAGTVHEAVWFQPTGRRGAYYGLDGQSKVRQFLASPLEFSRVTSGFAMRMHPLQHRMRAHVGVDYGAPQGTPVRSVGEGTVTFAGVQSGYGQIITIRHSADRETRYAHLSRIDVKVGQTLEQGQLIGAVGATGWATGPHLHFEFRVKGDPQDPLVVARESEALRIPDTERPSFLSVAAVARAQLGTSTMVATAQRFE